MVLERELLRTARRWQWAALRVAFAGALLAFVAISWKEQVLDALEWDPTALSWAGRRVFEGYAVIQTWLLILLTPILVSQGLIEERDGATLPLLAITRLRPRAVLLGKVGSRLLTLEAAVLGGMPFLALCLTLGGVAPLQVLNTFLQANAMMLGLAAVAGATALFARGPLLPSILAWFWAALAWTLGGLPMALWSGHAADMGLTSPLFALFQSDGGASPVPLLVAGAVAWIALRISEGVFAGLIEGDEDGDLLSAGRWAVDRLGRRLVLLAVGLTLLTLPVAVLRVFAARGWALGALLGQGATWLGTALAQVAATGLYLLAARRAARWLARRRGRASLGWEAELEGWGEASPEGSTRRRAPSSRHRHPWRNPVAWRETVTALHGGVGRYLRWFWLAALVTLLVVVIVAGLAEQADVLLGASFGALAVSWLVLALASASTAAGELRARSLSLLVVSRMSASSIVRGKLRGVLSLAGPPLLAALVLLVGGVVQFSEVYRLPWYGGVVEVDALIQRWAAMSLFAVAATAWLATSSLWVGLRVRTPGRAWVATLLNVLGWILLPVMVRLLVDGDSTLEGLVTWLNPAVDEGFWRNVQVPSRTWGSAGFWGAMSAVAFWRAARGVRRA